ncbi:MAG: cohesin domain-containing protein, partial [Anaerolineae bacterium]|nr:cohesin domain-containing protein [Anaerolineae bacterium]
TNLRVDRVDLVEVDSGSNVIGGPYWASGTTWYANQPDGSATTRAYTFSATPANWSNAAIRIFLRVGKYDPSRPETSYWAPWMPPVGVASLNGSGSAAGADYQCILWRLSSNTVEVVKSAPYYATAVSVGGLSVPEEPVAETAASVAPQASVIVSLTFPVAPPAYVGTPFAVDLSVSGATAKPVYGVEFDLRFNPAHLRVQKVEGAPDFRGPFGTWVMLTPTLSVINASGRLTDTAVVRLGAPAGLAEGRLARITFTPLVSVTSTALDLSDVWLADEHGRMYRPDSTLGASLRIIHARVYLPLVLRNF